MVEKTEQVNMKMSAQAKRLLKLAAEKEHRTMTNMVEYLVYDFCEKRGIVDPCKDMKANLPSEP